MKKIIRTVFCLMFTNLKFIFIKVFHLSKFKYHLLSICSPMSEIDMTGGSIEIGNKFRMRSNCHIRSRKNAKVIIGHNVSLNYGTMVVAHEMIQIGDNCQIAPNVMIYDHNHDYKVRGGINTMKFKTNPIVIGNNVWIGANTVILRGTVIGDNSVVGAGSVIKGKYPKGAIIVQKKQDQLLNRKQVINDG